MTMPHSFRTEQAVLGMMLTSKLALQESSSYLSPTDFYDPKHASIFNTILDVTKKGLEVDITTVTTELMNQGKLDGIGGADYLIDLTNSIASSANINSYIKILVEKSTLRHILRASDEIKEIAGSNEDVATIAFNAEKEILAATRKIAGGSFKKIDGIVDNVLQNVQEIEKNGGVAPGIKTAYEHLDRMTNGFQKGDYIIIGARPSMGKTAFSLNLLSRILKHNKNKAVAFFSIEMDAESITQRLISLEAGIDQQLLKRPMEMNESQKRKMYIAADNVGKAKLYIDDTPGIKLAELTARVRKLAVEEDLGIIFIDYLGLISSGKAKVENRAVEVSEISKALKQIARELKVPVVALSQLNRENESRSDKRPMLSDLRESGSIEQDADIIMFIHREKYYQPESDIPDMTEIIIRKHRNGPVGTIELTFNKECGQFTD